MKDKNTRRIAMTGIMAALICIIAPLSIPLSGGVPISLGTFIIMLSAVVLGPWMGTEATVVYILVGMVGLPVFSGYQAALSVLAGPTGGFIVGYIPLALFTGVFYRFLSKPRKAFLKYLFLTLGMVLGTACCYALGTIWFVFAMKSTLTAALTACVYPFLPLDALKIVIVDILGPQLEKQVSKLLVKDLRKKKGITDAK